MYLNFGEGGSGAVTPITPFLRHLENFDNFHRFPWPNLHIWSKFHQNWKYLNFGVMWGVGGSGAVTPLLPYIACYIILITSIVYYGQIYIYGPNFTKIGCI